jgi:hypothetical protein
MDAPLQHLGRPPCAAGHGSQRYAQAIPEAERLYEDYLEELRREGIVR